MKDYKVIQKMNNLLKKEEHKSLKKIFETEVEATIKNGRDYFLVELDTLYYPSKSFCVAIIYAHLLSFYFGESFWSSLDDEDLLNGNDDFFIPYSQNKITYDFILSQVGFNEPDFRLNLNLSQIERTFRYFTEEFDVDPRKYFILP